MPTRKITEPNDRSPCRDPEHEPPSMMVYANGLYEHECPSCGAKNVFRVNKPILGMFSRHEFRPRCNRSGSPYSTASYLKNT